MAEWRFKRDWSEQELLTRLEALRTLEHNFDPSEPKTPAHGWRRHRSESIVGREGVGPPEPEGAFQRARAAITRYEFSDPDIVTAHFDPDTPLQRRRMLLELKTLGLRFLVGAAVTAVREESGEAETTFGFRYDTLNGHIERGWEWFLLTKSHATGEIRFEINAVWQPGDFPNRWSRVGFAVLGRFYQRKWIARSHARLNHFIASHRPVSQPDGELLHQGPERVTEGETGDGAGG